MSHPVADYLHELYLISGVSVPETVWNYTHGGYQGLKKWLSYRECALLGRPPTKPNTSHTTYTASRASSLCTCSPRGGSVRGVIL